MKTERLKLLHRSHVVSFLIYIVVLAVLAGGLLLAWPSMSIWLVAILASSLLVALLFGIPPVVGFLPDRRRLLAFANVLATKQCPECGTPYELWAIERTAHLATPLCAGNPEREDLRQRWRVQCAKCGAWAGYGDDGTSISGGVMPIPLHRSAVVGQHGAAAKRSHR